NIGCNATLAAQSERTCRVEDKQRINKQKHVNKSTFQADVLHRLDLNNGKLTKDDFVKLTTRLIEDSPTSTGGSAQCDDTDTADLNLVYGPHRDLQRDQIERIAEKHDVILDDDTK